MFARDGLNFHTAGCVYRMLVEIDPAPMQGTAKAMLLRPRPHPTPRHQPKNSIGGRPPKPPLGSAKRSDSRSHEIRSKRGGGRGTFLGGGKTPSPRFHSERNSIPLALTVLIL